MIAFTKTAAVEVARRGVTINAVAPGLIATDMTEDIPEAFRERVPAQRVGHTGGGRRGGRLPGLGARGLHHRQHRIRRRRPVRLIATKGPSWQNPTTEQIEKVITESLISFGADADEINRDAELEALDIDSLDLAELSQIIEEQFGVELTSADVAEITTVGDAIDLVAERA